MRAFTDSGDGGHDGPRIRLTPGDDRTVDVSLDGPITMRPVDLRRLRRWLDNWLQES